MPQTLLALAAILCFSYYSIGRHRQDQEVDRRTIAAEVDLAAADVARALMTRVERNAFDEDDTGHRGIRTEPSDLPLGPDEFEDDPSSYDDVDDWRGYEAVETLQVGMGTLTFDTYVWVRYVDDEKLEEGEDRATLTKELTVVVVEQASEVMNRPPARVTLRHVVTPASISSSTPVLP